MEKLMLWTVGGLCPQEPQGQFNGPNARGLSYRCVFGYEGGSVCKVQSVSYGMKMSREFWLVKMDVHQMLCLLYGGVLSGC